MQLPAVTQNSASDGSSSTSIVQRMTQFPLVHTGNSAPSRKIRYQPLVDYRDRISIATWLVVFGLGASLLIELPTIAISLEALGSPIGILLGKTTLSALFLGVLAACGAQSTVVVHPRFAVASHLRLRAWAYGALPMALILLVGLILPEGPDRIYQVLIIAFSGGLFALTLFCLYATVEQGQSGFRRARLVLNTLAYSAALLLFLLVYQTRTRSLFSASLIALVAFLLAAEILRSTPRGVMTVLNYGAIIGLLLGQTTWALNYWRLPGLTGGLLLLLIFYLLVGIAQQGLQDRLTRRVLIEFAVFGSVALLLIIAIGADVG